MRNSEANKIDKEINLSDIKINPFFRLSTQNITTNLKLIDEEDEIVPRETLNSIYGDTYHSIKETILDTENKAINDLTDMITNLQVKYKEFNTDVNRHFRNLTSKITDAFKLNNTINENIKNSKKEKKETLIKNYSIEYIKQLQKIINVHQQIIEYIKKTFHIIYDYLDISKYLTKEKPINEFLSKEFKNIVQNWLFMKIDMENFDYTKAINESNFDADFKNLLIKIKKNQNFVMKISNPSKYMKATKKNFEKLHLDKANKLNNLLEENKKIIIDNHENLVKLKMRNTFYADKYFTPDLTYNKLKILKFDNVTFTTTEEKKNFFLKNMPSLEKLIINSATNLEISILEGLSKSLIKLSLTKNGFVDFEFNNIVSNYLVKSEHIRKKLQYLSFSDNYLSQINLSQIVYQPKHSFLSLKELDFQNNKIYQFSMEPDYFPELKSINCCNNNLTRNSFEQFEKILTLSCGNIFLSQKNLAEKYFSSLAKKLNTYTISLTYLNLSFIPKILSDNYIKDIIINDSILINLKKLDLSYNNLSCDSILSFLNNNKGCLSLKSLNLSNNLLDIDFFQKFLDSKLNAHFIKLKYIKLDANLFGKFEESGENNNEENINLIRLLYTFIHENKNLVDLSITKNPLCKNLMIKTIEVNVEKSPNSFNFNNYVTRNEEGNIEIKCFYSFLWKIKIEMNEENKKNKSEIRPIFNIKFDCINSINNNSEDFEFNTNYIVFVNQGKNK